MPACSGRTRASPAEVQVGRVKQAPQPAQVAAVEEGGQGRPQ